MVRERIAGYLEQNFLFQFDADVTENTDLFKAGIIDSFGYVRMMRFLQEEFQIRFAKDELLSNIITSLSGIVASVERKLATAHQA